MITPFCDFHTHTSDSDGRLSPKELITKAYEAGIRVMSITDHNVSGDLTELRSYAAAAFEEEMTLIQGAEISAVYSDSTGSEQELHIVALGFDADDPGMKAMLAAHQPDRRAYIEAILKRLKEDCGIDIGTYDEIRVLFPDTKYIGRMALARLMTDRGITATVDEAFDIYLGVHGQRRAYVRNPLRYSSLEEVVRTVIRSGGTPILAHLLYYDLDDDNRTGGEEKERLVRTFSELVHAYNGIGGMEVYYTRYKDMDERLYLLGLARKYGLLISAGSDYHAQESWETLEHRTSCSACSDLLDHLGVQVRYPLAPAPLYVASGFSGVGKGTICEILKNRQINGKPVALIRSYTNRPRRSENDPYNFVSREEFTALAKANKFLEYNDAYAENGYATPADAVKEAFRNGQSVLLEIDRIGLTHLLTDGKINPNLVRSVFIVADAEDVALRLYLRGTEPQRKIRSRLQTAMAESGCLGLYDAVIANEVVDDAVEAVIEAFLGNPPENTFDPVKFRSDMEQVLTCYWRTPEGLLYDPVEDTDKYRAAMVSINAQLAAEFTREDLEAKSCPAVWRRKQELLKARGIHWRTPAEMNP